MAKRSRYLSYLLRLWQTHDGETWIWRASLESPGTGDRHGFASLKALIDFLEAQTNASLVQDEHGLAYYDPCGTEGGEEADKNRT